MIRPETPDGGFELDDSEIEQEWITEEDIIDSEDE
jgi:hypothetical protein